MKEIFKDIEGYENLYQISDQGRVKALGNGGSNASKEKILKPVKDGKKYLRVNLYKQGKRKMCKIHRLVAQAFIDNPNNYEEVNHRDENPANNAVQNLEWVTPKYNINYGTRNERVAESNTNHPNKSKQVLCIETGKIYPSAMEAARQTGFNKSAIIRCCNGKLKTAYSYTWQYVS